MQKHPTPDIVTPPEPHGEELAEILQMAEDSARRSMDKVRPQMERSIRAVLRSGESSDEVTRFGKSRVLRRPVCKTLPS